MTGENEKLRTESPPCPAAPRWVKTFGAIAILLFMFVLINLITGGAHGPARHAPSIGTESHAGWGRLALLGVLLIIGVAFNWDWLADRGLIPSSLGKFSPARRWPSSGRAPATMAPGLRKTMLIAHVTSSVGSLGAVSVFLTLAVIGLTSQDAQVVRAVYIANGFIAWTIILPLILAALMIGVIQSLATPWGLFRHYWVLAKFLITILAIIVLLQQMDGISRIAAVATQTGLSRADFPGLRASLRLHAGGGLAVLLVLVMLSVLKPRGLTRHGWQKQTKQAEQRVPRQPDTMSGDDAGL